MSCKHGNWSDCELCEEEDSRWTDVFNAGKESAEKMKLILRECEVMLSMLSSSPPVEQLRTEIAKILQAK